MPSSLSDIYSRIMSLEVVSWVTLMTTEAILIPIGGSDIKLRVTLCMSGQYAHSSTVLLLLAKCWNISVMSSYGHFPFVFDWFVPFGTNFRIIVQLARSTCKLSSWVCQGQTSLRRSGLCCRLLWGSSCRSSSRCLEIACSQTPRAWCHRRLCPRRHTCSSLDTARSKRRRGTRSRRPL